MKHRLVLHSLNHQIVVLDITSINLESQVDRGSVPFIRTNWDEVIMHLKALGASDELIEGTKHALRKQDVTVATIV